MKDVMIRIFATQSGDDPREQTDLAEFSTEGQMECADGVGMLTYPESELTGMDGTTTTITFNAEGAVLTRRGTLTNRMVFTPGERNTFLYETPYGTSTVGLETQRYSSTLTEHGGELSIDYVIDFDHAFVGINHMRITVTEKKEYSDREVSSNG